MFCGRLRYAHELLARTADAILIIEERADGVRLVEHWREGLLTDTWHATVEDAKLEAQNWWQNQLIGLAISTSRRRQFGGLC